ncbi:MAG: GEVED domain-containing protein [Cyanobacteria bacterium J06634_6]
MKPCVEKVADKAVSNVFGGSGVAITNNCRKLVFNLAIASTLALSALIGCATTAKAEGSAQIGLNQPMFEYGVSFSNTATGIFSPNHAIYVDTISANEVINISVCGNTNADPLRVEIYQTTPNLDDPVLVPTTGTQVLNQALASSNVDCANGMTTTLTTPLQFTASTPGTYEVRLFNESTAANGILRRVDVTVTPDAATPVDPTLSQGRIYAYSWAFNAGGYTTAESANTDYFIKVPGGRPGDNFVWRLDLNNFAGFIYEIIANNLGVDSPYEGLSANFVEDGITNTLTPRFPLYLSFPQIVGTRPTVPPEVTQFKFTDSDGVDNSISPSDTSGVQDTGTFSFNTDIDGTFLIVIDADQDGQYAPSPNSPKDTFIFGTATPGSNSVVWDGTDNEGNPLPEGTYTARLQVRLGEFHFVASDAETSGGGANDGLTVFESIGGVDADTLVFWDDLTLLGATTTLPNGQPSSSPLSRHTWGNNDAAGFGNRRMIDTYVYGDETTVTSAAIIGTTDTPLQKDYGDAPDTSAGGNSIADYETTEADGGPNHIIVPELRIGAAPDTDDGTQQNTAADEDDVSGGDEGDIALPELRLDAATYTVGSIAVTNTTTEPSYLVGWVDFDQSGTFDSDEQAVSTVASGDTTADLVWNTIPSDIAAGTTYVRFRLGSTEGLGPTGGAIDGEVEDYAFAIASDPSVLLTKRITAINRNLPDEQTFDTSYINVGTNDDNDNATNWPGPPIGENFGGAAGTVEQYIAGIAGVDPGIPNPQTASPVAGVVIKPGESLEYTISFLSDGEEGAQDLLICDRIPTNTTFNPTAFNSSPPAAAGPGDRGILLSFDTQTVALTNANDGDEIADSAIGANDGIGGYYFPAGVEPGTALGMPINCNGANDNGAIVVDLSDIPNTTGEGTPLNAFGFIRFRVIVD